MDASTPNDPAVTLALLDAKAVVGLTGHRNANGGLASVGIQCSLCHSTVDNSVAPGIGRRLDGWPNRDLNVGAIIALAPDLSAVADLLQTDQPTVRKVLNSWGVGKFDAQLFLDGKAFRPDGKSAATLLPAAFGLAGVNLHTYTGWGGVSHWNAFVANLEMHGKGTFIDARLNDPLQFPVAARAGFGNVRNTPDLITSKLPALQYYQLSIPAPEPPRGSFDARAAAAGKAVFNGAARCATCHVPPLFTELAGTCTRLPKSGSTTFSPAGRGSALPDHAARWLVHPPEGRLLPRRPLRRPRAVVEHSQPVAQSQSQRAGEEGSDRVLEVALGTTWTKGPGRRGPTCWDEGPTADGPTDLTWTDRRRDESQVRDDGMITCPSRAPQAFFSSRRAPTSVFSNP
jgi:hypothetical protein